MKSAIAAFGFHLASSWCFTLVCEWPIYNPTPSIFCPHFLFLDSSSYINRDPFELTLGPCGGVKIFAS